ARPLPRRRAAPRREPGRPPGPGLGRRRHHRRRGPGRPGHGGAGQRPHRRYRPGRGGVHGHSRGRDPGGGRGPGGGPGRPPHTAGRTGRPACGDKGGGRGLSLLVENIGELVTNDPGSGEGRLGLIRDAALVLQESWVAWVGPAQAAPEADERYDAGGRAVLPGFVDSHTHLVFAGDRAAEFATRMEPGGGGYPPGGIQATAAAT